MFFLTYKVPGVGQKPSILWTMPVIINIICLHIGPRDYHTKQSKSESGRQTPYDITTRWNLKYDKNEVIYKTETGSQTEVLMVANGEEGGGGKDWEFGNSTCNLVYIGWIDNTVLLYGKGNYIQYAVINHNGK